ncbi:CotH kinase family protein [Gorillibacterium timonense]|uniref:CotH kinase family protein n=1 Tax=Gorillibacterium timonense TaxID=1689269 RepID=UPI00071E554D|nr:CotH kinase family protein [Gorillibacterium timonense]
MIRFLKKGILVAASAALVATAALGFGGIPPAEAASTSAGIAQEYESLFSGDRIINVKVTIADDDWQSILESPLDKDYKKVSVEVDGRKLDNVGFSTKGNLTLKAVASMTDSDRYSFRLKFDKYDKNQTLLGLDKLTLNNSYSDPSFLREYLHYEALRQLGMDAPLTVFTNLYINGELYGFYVGVESIDDSYLARNYGDTYKDGVLYDTEEGSYLQYEESGEYKTITEDLGTDENKSALQNFIKTLNEMPAGEKGSIESVLDVDSALKYIAANAVLGNYDSYNGDKGHNYMLYGDAKGKFTVVPWDFNMSFNGYSGGGGRPGGQDAGTATDTATNTSTNTPTNTSTKNTDAVTAAVDLPVLGIEMDQVPLINNLLKVPEYKTRYLEYVKELTQFLSGVPERIEELADLIRPSVEADPTKFYTMEDFEASITYSANEQQSGGMGGTPPTGAAEGGAGMTPPDGNAPTGTPPTGTQPTGTPPAGAPTGANPPERPDGSQGGEPANGQFPAGGGGQGMGTMKAGSIMTFAWNRLVNLQKQLGLTVTELPNASGTTAGAGTSTTPSNPGTPSTTGNSGISVTLDGKKLTFPDQQPYLHNQRTLVPVAVLLEQLGGKVTWNSSNKTATVVKDNQTLTFTIGSATVDVNGRKVTMAEAAALTGNRTMVPVAFLVEQLGYRITWDNATSTVRISSPAAAASPAA